jgi:hypothetical protein
MDHESQQLLEVLLPLAGPLLVGIAVFLFIWLFLKRPLQRLIDQAVSKTGSPWLVSKSFRLPIGSLGIGDDHAGADRMVHAGQGSQSLKGAQEAWQPRPLDPARWEQYLARWRQGEAQFAREPAEAVRGAEQLLMELTRERGGSTSVVREFMRTGGSTAGGANRTTPLISHADFGPSLADALLGISRLIPLVRQARAAARGISAARGHRDASIDELQAAMGQYRAAFEQLLGVERRDLDFFGAGSQRPAASVDAPSARPEGGDSAADAARQRVIANKIVREAMTGYDRAEARADVEKAVRWGVFQFLGSLAVGLAILVLLAWLLGLQ